jgi:NAD(P)-dependent dehydrogenase (short-subunit alcohol dehydrogenase family)
MTDQKSILITGCSSGIGLHCANRLHEKGYRVIATARNNNDVQELQSHGLTAFRLDLDDSESIRDAVEQTLTICHGRLDALFNNGAYGQPGAVEDLSRDVLRAQFETNLFGPFELINHVIPVMRKQGHGRIIQNSSVLGLITLPYRGAYNASKFALEGLTDTLRLELRNSPITLSLIEPGPIESQFRKNAFRAYETNIDKNNSAHKLTYDAMERRLKKSGPAAPFTLPPEAVYKKLQHALESRHPKIRYYVTFPTYFFAILKRILPYNLLDNLLIAISRGENK